MKMLSQLFETQTGLKLSKIKQLSGVSKEAVQKATGRTWEEWIDYLDRQAGRERSHKSIVKLLKDNKVASGWWRQMITSAYERHIGRKKEGEMASGFQVGVQKTLPVSLSRAWQFLTSDEGLEIWLGTLKGPLQPGTPFTAKDGIKGKLSIVKRHSHIRLFWHPRHWQKHSRLQVRFMSKGEKTSVRFHHESLPDQQAREAMRKRWKAALRSLKTMLDKSRGGK